MRLKTNLSNIKSKFQKIPASRRAGVLVWMYICTQLILPTLLFAAEPEQFVEQGNSLYAAGDFQGAVQAYSQAIDSGADNGFVHYNLGNAYFRLKKYGYAIAHYREALVTLPNDADLRANLKLARKHAVDRIESPNEQADEFSKQFVSSLPRVAPYFAKLFFLFAYAIFWLSWSILSVSSRSSIRVVRNCAFLLIFFIAPYVFSIKTDRTGEQALAIPFLHESFRSGVVLPGEAKVFSGNGENYQVIFLLHSGAEVSVGEIRQDWVEVLLPEARKGWLKAESLAIISEE